jgi:hypothetical protein
MALSAVSIIPLTVGAFGCPEMLPKMIILEGLTLGGGGNQDVAPLAPIPSIRTSPGNKLLPAKTETSIAPVSGSNKNFGLIKEFQRYLASLIPYPLWSGNRADWKG